MGGSGDARTDTGRHVRVPFLGHLVPPYRSDYVDLQPTSAGILLVAVALALLWTNLPAASDSYQRFWHLHLTVGSGDIAITNTFNGWINEGVMAVFFFVVALEMKREVVDGELRTRRRALVPLVGAIGGMAVPALIYLALNAGTPQASGWAVPMATDTAFAVGLLALFGPRVPRNVKVLLTSLAVVDDLGAIAAIALFYGNAIDMTWIPVAMGAVTAVVLMRVRGVRQPLVYVPVAVLLWVAVFESGFHATVTGVILGFLVPSGSPRQRETLHRLETDLRPWALLVVIPIFTFANAGVKLTVHSLTGLGTALAIGIMVGLVVGKPVGILLGGLGMARTGLGELPSGVHGGDVAMVGTIAGVGFTVSLFIAELAFTGPSLVHAKVAILVGSAVSAALGCASVARRHARPTTKNRDDPRVTAGSDGADGAGPSAVGDGDDPAGDADDCAS
jgi:NhaA family Na+:H+ antiporter